MSAPATLERAWHRRVGYLGPRGTFTEEALASQRDLRKADHVTLASMPRVLGAVGAGTLDLGFVALENSIGGSVNASLDSLVFDHALLIQREVVHDIRLSLMAPAGTRLRDVATVLSFPNALTQCRGFLAARLPRARTMEAPSTAEAAQRVSRCGDATLAAVGPSAAARLYGLDVLATDIQDLVDNHTRFVLVGRPELGIPPATGRDKTTIVCFQRGDRPGSLRSILEPFAARDINLTSLHSRPARRCRGDHCFVIDVQGHISDEAIADCLRELARTLVDVRFLGSYPARDGPRRSSADPHDSPDDATARRWVESLQASVRACRDAQAHEREGQDRWTPTLDARERQLTRSTR